MTPEEPSTPIPVRSELEVQVRFGDTDALGHVNNAAYASYAELGRIDLLKHRNWEESGPVLARLAIDFVAQVRIENRVVVTTRVARIGRSSITMDQEILADDRLAARIAAVVVWIDYRTERPIPVPEELRRALGVPSESVP